MVIDVLRKIWRPKVKCRYKLPLYNKDMDEGIFLFDSLGAAVFRPEPWAPGVGTYFILFDENLHGKEFNSVKINRGRAAALLPTLEKLFEHIGTVLPLKVFVELFLATNLLLILATPLLYDVRNHTMDLIKRKSLANIFAC